MAESTRDGSAAGATPEVDMLGEVAALAARTLEALCRGMAGASS